MIKRAFITLLVAVATLVSASAQMQVGTITGKVVARQDRQPIEMASVTLDGQTVQTDAQGRFTFEGIPYGTVTIFVEAIGYSSSNVNVKVDRPEKDINYISLAISDFMTKYWYYILILLIVAIAIFVLLYKSSKSIKYGVQYFLMHVPVVKEIIKYNQLVTFTSTFATLIKHDVFITDSMDILRKITDNEIYKKIINEAINNLSKGNGLSVAFKGHWAFPETAYEMLLTGEKTGKLGEMLEHVSTYYQEEQTNIVSRLKSLIEPLMIIILAVLVGVILLSVVVPMFDIYSKII